jgi:fructose-1,6-bisphosphatase II / sedoheptulose-1,7-bisphosphatase
MSQALDRVFALEAGRVTEAAAIAAADQVGRGDKNAADGMAVEAMRKAFSILNIEGTVMIGEGEMDEAPMLYIGEKVGHGGTPVDIAVDPLEGTNLAAKALPNALAVLALAEPGTLLNAPDMYMDKIAIGGGYPEGTIDLDADAETNIRSLAHAKGVSPREITACVLDRPRHAHLIDGARKAGAAVRLISDGDVAGVIATADPATGIDIYMGKGGAPEGVLAAAALRCVGGQMQTRLDFQTDEERIRAGRMGISDLNRKYSLTDLASGDVIFAATGVTDGSILPGIKREPGYLTTETILMRSKTGSVRRMTYRNPTK